MKNRRKYIQDKKKFIQELEALNISPEFVEWGSTKKNWQEIYNDCLRGDWLLLIYASFNNNDFQYLALALCAYSLDSGGDEDGFVSADVVRASIPIERFNFK
jgi:hypothetical protein